jgi:uncharacterized repeat protein (TIGR01451 family)
MRLLKALAMGAAILAMSFSAMASAQPTADLSVSLKGRPDPMVIDETGTWTITVRNLGPGVAADVVLEAAYGSDASRVSATTTQGTCTQTVGGLVDFSLGTIAPGGSVTATLVLQVYGSDGGIWWVKVASSTKDPKRRNNRTTGRVEVISGPESGPPFEEPLRGTLCPPNGGASTGGGGTAAHSQPWLTWVGVGVAAGLAAAAARRVRR